MDGVSPATADLYEMANLYPRTTGLPMTVWVCPRGGNEMVPEGAAVVGIRPEPRRTERDLSRADLDSVARWISLNREALIALREGEIDTIELGQRLIRA